MKSALFILSAALLLPTLCFAQPLWQDNFEDGNYTANPPWFYYSGGVQMSQFGGDWCLDVHYATPPIDSSGIIFTGIPQTQEFTLEFDLHRRWQTGYQNNIRIGFTEGPFQPNTGFELMENDLNNLQLRWNGQTVSQVPIPGMQYAWIHVVMHRFPCGNWQVTWDEGGPHQTTISGQDQFGTLTNPHLYLECDGWYSQQRGAYFDNFVMNAPQQPWPLIYEEDFSSNPGWVTNNPARFHWNPADQNYYGELVNWAQEYGVYPLPQVIEGSFKIEYDAKLIQVQWGSGFDFGIFSDTIGYLQPSTLNLEFDNPDPGPQFDAWWFTPQGGGTFGSPNDWQLNVWYHVVLMYNAETHIASFQVTQNGMPIASSSTQIIGQYQGLCNLGLSRRWSWPPSGQTAKGYVDNVKLFASPPGGYPGEFVVDDHTAALWHFNENSGLSAHDATANHYDMSLQDGAGWHAPGWNNTPSAVDLTDPDAKVNSNYTVGNGWDAITLEAWIYPTQIGPFTGWFCDHPIITRQEFHNVSDCSYYLYLTALGEIYAGVNLNQPGGAYSQALTEQNLIQVNNWYHVAATWSSGEPLRVFVNDMNNPVVTSPQVETGAIRTGTDALRIGCNWTVEYYNEWEYFQGYIDEARISDIDRYPVQPGGPPFTPDEFTQGLWHFNEAPGTYVAFDASGYGYNLSLQDGASFTLAGHFAGAVDLTDPDAKVNSVWLIGNGWEALTIDAFIYPTVIAGSERPIVERYRWYASDPSYFLTVTENGQLYGGVYVGASGPTHSTVTTAPGVIEINNWYHVAMTWSSGEPSRLFLNGELIGTSEEIYAGSIRAGDDPLTIGWFHDEGYGDFYFQGKIDEVRLSNTVRYEATPPPPPPPICFEEHWNDGNWTVNPTWWEYENQGNFAINNSIGHAAPPCLKAWAGNVGTDYTALYTPVNCGTDFVIDFWARRNTPTFGWGMFGITQGAYSAANQGFFIYVYQNNMNNNWYLGAYMGSTLLAQEQIAFPSDRWYHLQMARSPNGNWTILWDLGGPEQEILNAADTFTSLTNPYFRITPVGYYDITGGFYLDDIVISSPEPPGGPVQITLTPLNPPLLIPQNGGSFSFHVTIENTSSTVQLCDIWSYIQLPPPGGLVPSLGPIALNLPPNSSMTRLRTQVVPASAPPGNYLYWGSIGDYPWNVMQTVHFPFIKAGVDIGGNALEGWLNTGEPFPGEGLAADALPAKYALHEAFPNPFNPTTLLRFDLPAAGIVELSVYDISGRLVATLVDGWREAGEHQVTFDGAELPSGIYLARLTAGDYIAVQKLVLMK